MAQSNVEEKKYLMSSRPEAGQEEAREDDGLDLELDREAGEGTQGVTHESATDINPVRNDIDRRDGISESAERQITQQKAETGRLDSLQERRPQDASVQLREDAHSADGTSSIPDDTPSIQVLSTCSIC